MTGGMTAKLFLHGVPDSPAIWSPLLDALALGDTPVAVPALPGFTGPLPAGFAGALPSEPKPPAITLRKLRFMALHMMYDRIAPLEPTSAPVTISRSLPSMKPVAAAAQPE